MSAFILIVSLICSALFLLFLSILKFTFVEVYVCVPVCLYVYHVYAVPARGQKRFGSPGTGGIAMGAGNCTWALRKCNKCSSS